MKRLILLGALLALVCAFAMADDLVATASACGTDDALFVGIDAPALTLEEMEAVTGGQQPDMDGSVGMYSPYSKTETKNSDYVPTKAQVKESLHAAVDIGIDCPKSVGDVIKELAREAAHKVIDRW